METQSLLMQYSNEGAEPALEPTNVWFALSLPTGVFPPAAMTSVPSRNFASTDSFVPAVSSMMNQLYLLLRVGTASRLA